MQFLLYFLHSLVTKIVNIFVKEAKKLMPSMGTINVSIEEKPVSIVEEQPIYASKTVSINLLL